VDKKFTFGLIALLSVSLFLLGCQHDGFRISKVKTPEQMAAELVTALGGSIYAKATGAKVTLLKNATVNNDLAVEAGVTLMTSGKTLDIKKNFKVSGNVVIDTAVAPAGDVTVDATGVITVSGNAGKLTIAKTKNLKNRGTVTLTKQGSIVLTGDGINGAKLTGTGKVVAGATEIVGGTNGWQAVNSGNVIIAAGTAAKANEARITATSVLTAGAGATITQLAVAGNNLEIAMNTIINLGNAAGKKSGSIVFKQSNINPAQVTLGFPNVVIKVNDIAGTVTNTAAGMFVTGNAANNKLLCSSLTASHGITLYISGDKLCKIAGGDAVQTIKAQAADANSIADVVLSAESAVK
jgi:hypothetical protein